MADSITVTLDKTSFGSVQTMFEILRHSLPMAAGGSMLEGSVLVNNKMIEGVTEVLLIDESRTRSEIEINDPSFSTLSDYKPKVISKGKPIRMIDFPNDSAHWKKRGSPPIHVQIFKDRENHEFRHVYRTRGQLREKPPGTKKAHILTSVRVQDIQAQDYFIDPIMEEGADESTKVFLEKADEILNA
jgi:hypothetical protein